MANACGPCIGQWARHGADKQEKNSIMTSFNRNFAKRNDGNPNTHGFVASPEIVTAYAIAGDLAFNPMTDYLENERGEKVKLDEPEGIELPVRRICCGRCRLPGPCQMTEEKLKLSLIPKSDRLQLLDPFAAWDGNDL